MFMKLAFITLIGILLSLVVTSTAYAHGAQIEYQVATSIEMHAKYDSGEPMSEAQVSVYAPNDPSTPWLKGTCDKDGHFSFTPDSAIPGTWDIQVRQAGHGDMIHIDIEEGAVVGGSSSDYATGQIIIMSVCVLWGLLGTALFFKRRKC